MTIDELVDEGIRKGLTFIGTLESGVRLQFKLSSNSWNYAEPVDNRAESLMDALDGGLSGFAMGHALKRFFEEAKNNGCTVRVSRLRYYLLGLDPVVTLERQ